LSSSAYTSHDSRVHEAEELLDIWHGLQQSAADSAIDRERVFAPTGRRRTFWAL